MNKPIQPDWLEKNGEMLVRAYTLAKLKEYDVNSRETALQLLKIVDPDHATEEYVDSFYSMLQLFDRKAKKNFKKKQE